jgi:hypothetical protein
MDYEVIHAYEAEYGLDKAIIWLRIEALKNKLKD